MANTGVPVMLGPGEGTKTPIRGGEQTIKVANEEVDGSFGLWESTIKGGPGRHIHHTTEEAFYVLEGEVAFRLDGTEARLGPGGFALVPRGTIHGFSTEGESPARLLVLMSPGGFEHWFDELASELESSDGNLKAALQTSGRKYDTEFLD